MGVLHTGVKHRAARTADDIVDKLTDASVAPTQEVHAIVHTIMTRQIHEHMDTLVRDIVNVIRSTSRVPAPENAALKEVALDIDFEFRS